MRILIFAIAMISLTSCVSLMPPASSIPDDPTSILLVGKFEILPPIDVEYEQETHWNIIGDDRILNTIVMLVGSIPVPVNPNQVSISDYNGAIEAKWGESFFLTAPKQKTYFRGGVMQLDLKSSDKIWFPGGFYYQPLKRNKAIYIGTLRFFRDDFFEIKKAVIVDEYSKILPIFKNRFGKKAVLTKSLLKRVK